MTPNPYLSAFPNNEVETLVQSGSIDYRFDDSFNLLIDRADVSMFSSSITLPLISTSFEYKKVETKYNTTFTEMT